MTNLFAGKDTINGFGGIGNNPNVQIKVNDLLWKLGIRDVSLSSRSRYDCDSSQLVFNNLTLIINPLTSDFSYDNYDIKNFLRSKFKYYDGHAYALNSSFEINEFPIIAAPKGEENGDVRGTLAGCYYPRRNMLCAFFNPFQHFPADENYDKTLELFEWFVGLMKEQGIKLRSVNTDKLKEQFYMERFLKNVQADIQVEKNYVSQHDGEIQNYGVALIEASQNRQRRLVKLKSLESLMKVDTKILCEQVKQIRGLPFVKKVGLTVKGIDVHVGKLSIKAEDYDENNNSQVYETYLGDYTIRITPNSVIIVNGDMLPGVPNPEFNTNEKGQMCTGTAHTKVFELVGHLKFKEAIYLVYSLLKCYNIADHRVTLSSWAKARIVENKFDVKGNLLKKKVEVREHERVETISVTNASS